MKYKKILFLFFLFFVIGCGHIELIEENGVYDYEGNKIEISKKNLDKNLKEILNEKDFNNLKNSIDNLEKDVVYYNESYTLKDKSLLYKEISGYNIICLSILFSDNDLLEYLVKFDNNVISHQTSNGCLPIKLAIQMHNYEIINYLLNQGLNITKNIINYALENKEYDIVYFLLNKKYNSNIPLSIYIKYAQNKDFKQKTFKNYFKTEILNNLTNENDLERVMNSLNSILTYDEKINLYLLIYKKKNILPKNQKFKEIVLLKSHPALADNYYDISKLQKYLENFDFSQKDAQIIYKMAKKRLINLKFYNAYDSNNITYMENFIKTYPSYPKNYLLKRRIAELSYYAEFELDSKLCNKNSFKWQGSFKNNFPYGKGCFYCTSRLKKGFFWSAWQKSLICFNNIKKYNGYIKTNLFIYKLLSTKKIGNSISYFKSKYDIANALVKNINANIKTYNSIRNVSVSNVDCNKIKNDCLKNCKFKNSKNGFFIFTQSDKSKCQSYCYLADSSCKEGNLNEMKTYICYAKCVGYKTTNGGFLSSSDYDKCVNKCIQDN